MTHPTRIRPGIRRYVIALALLAGVAAPSMAAAQAMIAPTSTPTADALASHMRALAADAGNLRALIGAGEASAKLGDGAAAMQFFARAERIDPRNPRIAAGRGRALVAMERPGEALKYFAEAERLGLSPADYADDRGLAYDLMGYPANAQADYRLALSRGSDDEITRRLALSLGISGKREEAARLLDTMLRANDRQAWRVQAMVVAMDGDFAMADRIAASMMPGFGPNLAPFFRRLPALSPGDRAFAGHFGQLQRTPQRMADASMAPPMGAQASTPTMLADAGTARREAEARVEPRTTRNARARERTQMADNRASRRATRDPQSAVRAAVVTDVREPVQLAAAERPAPTPAPSARQSNAALAQLASIVPSGPSSVAAPPGAMVQAVPSASAPGVTLAASSDEGPVGARLSTDSRGVLSLTRPAERALEMPPSMAATTAPTASAPQPAFGTAVSPATVTAPANARVVGDNDDVIGRIMRGISVPGSELGVAPMPGSAPAPGIAEPIAAAPEPKSEPASIEKVETPPPAKVVEKPAVKATAKPVPKPAAKKPAAPADPARHWVQVAGGARAADLYKDWDRLAKQSPAAFKGKQGWTTPLRATNRLLAGPFKTSGEAQTFVNAIAKDGISAFAWESEAGQKIETLNR
ncbi:CHAT domain-containing protein [Sphingomonas sp. AX6]|uniref:CHAT domain-containing protein n=1 Tax=Sphingomonas sp. AX6 TaxID=2653171 RepID=UPI0012F15D74|nr:SPOR domain-containing protein [Sphingomonas sp. AX6]VXC44175.1 Sporulation protein [Sphingomonas sp. AX6]